MSYTYQAICKKNMSMRRFSIESNKKYSYRTASGIDNEKLFIIFDNNGHKHAFSNYYFNEFFWTEKELRKEKIKKLNEGNL